MPVNVGSVEGSLILKDQWTEVLKRSGIELGNTSRQTTDLFSRTDKLQLAYRRLVTSLDPVAARTQKYHSAQDVLNQSLQRGLIDQKEYNTQLALAKTRYMDASAEAVKMGRELSGIGNQLSTLGGSITRFLTLPILAVGAGSIKAASDFESSFAGVRKTVDATEEEFAQLSAGIRDLAAGPQAIPINVNELNRIGEAAGQLGIRKEAILGFIRTIADLSVATNLTSQQASDDLARLANITRMPQENFDRLGSTVVALGNAFAGTESEIVGMALRIAGAGNQIGLTEGQILAFATALSSVGIEAEMGGSAISKVMINIASAVSKGGRELHNFAAVSGLTVQQFEKLFRDDAAAAVNAFITGLTRMKDSGQDVLGALAAMGIEEVRMRDTVLRAAGAGDILTRALNLQAKAWSENTALTDEATKRYQTFQSQLTITWNRIRETAITFGTALLPAVRDLLEILQPLIDRLGEAARWFSELPKGAQISVLALGALAAAIGPVLIVAGQLITAWGTIITLAPRLSAAIGIATGPWGALAAAITLATSAIGFWISQWKQASQDAMAVTVQLGNLEGAALGFSRAIQQSGGKVTESVLSQAWKDADQLARQVLAAQKTVDDLKAKLSKAGPDQALIIRTESLPEAQRSLNSLNLAWERQKKALSGVTEVIKDTTTETGGLTNQNTGLVNILGKVSSKEQELAEDLANTRKELLQSIESQQLLADRFDLRKLTSLVPADIEKQTAAIKKAQDLYSDYLKDVDRFGKKAADSLSGLREAKYDAAEAAKKAEERWKSYTKALSEGIKPIEIKFDVNKGRISNLIRDLNLPDVIVKLSFATVQGFDSDRSIDEWMEFGERIREGLATSADQVEKYMRDLEYAVKEGYILPIEYERELSRLRVQLLNEQIDQITSLASGWQQFFSTIGSMFGGFAQTVATYLQQMISISQQLQSAGNQIGGSMGAMVSAAGPFLAVVGAIYSAQKASIARSRQRQMTASVTLTDEGDFELYSRLGLRSRAVALANALESALQPILDLLGRTLGNLPEITIRAREDGKKFQAVVNGAIVGWFETMEEAIDAAALAAIQAMGTQGLSDAVRRVLERTGAQTAEALLEDLNFARWYERLGLSDLAQRLFDLVDEARQAFQNADRLGLELGKIQDWLEGRINDLKAELLGIDMSGVNALRTLRDFITALNEIGEQQRAPLQATITALQSELEQLLASGPRMIVTEGGRLMQETQTQWERNVQRLREQIAHYVSELDKIPEALSEQEVSLAIWNVFKPFLENSREHQEMAAKFEKMRVQAQFEGLRLELVRLQLWEQWAGVWQDAFNIAMEAAGKPSGGRGGRGGQRQAARDFITDRTFELALSTMGEYERRVAEVTRTYEEQIEQAGRDRKLRAELITLRERELEILAEQRRTEVTGQFREFLRLVTPFSRVRDTATDLIKAINDSPFGDAQKAGMISRVMEDVDRQLQRLSDEMAAGLLGNLAQYITDETLRTQLLAQQEILNYNLRIELARTEFEILKAEGRLAPQVLATIQQAFNWFDENRDKLPGGANWNFELGGGTVTVSGPDFDNGSWVWTGAGWVKKVEEAGSDLGNELERARDLLERYQDDALDPFTRELKSIADDFAEIEKVLGVTPEVLDAKTKAIARAFDDLMAPIRDVQRDLFFSDSSPFDTMTQWDRIQAELAEAQSRWSMGDLSIVEEIPDLVQQYVDILGQVAPRGSEGFNKRFMDVYDFLNEVQTFRPGALGSSNNPMNIAGMASLSQLTEEQIDVLGRINDNTVRVALAVEELNRRVPYGGLAKVA